MKQKEELAERFNAAVDALIDFEPSEVFKGFDFPQTPIILNDQPKSIQLANWGLIPQWSNTNDIRRFTLNARIETLDEKPSFKDAIKNRCLILADGFYEWQWLNSSGTNKNKYLLHLANDEAFAFAGIYDAWTDFDQKTHLSYSIVTTAANSLMSGIHNTKQRMPVILKKEDEINWLSGHSYSDYSNPYEVPLIAKNLDKPASQLGLFDL